MTFIKRPKFYFIAFSFAGILVFIPKSCSLFVSYLHNEDQERIEGAFLNPQTSAGEELEKSEGTNEAIE